MWPCQPTYDTQHLRPISGGEGAACTHTASQHALQETDRERQIQSTGCQHSSKRLTLCPHQTHTPTPIPPGQQQSSTTAQSQPAVWPCQMTYDTQHLKPFGGGALSNAHTHREAREQQAHKRHRSMHCKRQRETDPKQWVSALEQETYILSSPDAYTHTHPTHCFGSVSLCLLQ
eukprot:COSAG06_NODE_25016_length_647_cov_1.260949_1_plen_173_part_10